MKQMKEEKLSKIKKGREEGVRECSGRRRKKYERENKRNEEKEQLGTMKKNMQIKEKRNRMRRKT